ncbi:hypothetical protein L0666_16990 [Octadecabacter sp. CECT 8868]|uniref:right-handed parallel beta-helix repeat-containing protein n=1 Tax=Octadecabacter algicola TaxID=2909342 RepID=UPI001F3E9ADF|nr:right-handed parallel beta-helix repeat-containing protein [Octadecabacter algicola]MCF2906693.1 hypothetical protein [Octadecabacter algicola]
MTGFLGIFAGLFAALAASGPSVKSNGKAKAAKFANDEAVDPVTPVVEETPDVVSEETPDVVVEATPDVVVEATPDVVVEETPDVVVEETPDVVIEATPDVVVEETPDVVVEATPDVVVEETPDVVVEEASDAVVEVVEEVTEVEETTEEDVTEPEDTTAEKSTDVDASTIDAEFGGTSAQEIQLNGSDDTFEIMEGRVHAFTLDSTDEIASIKITDQPDFGNVTVNPDNSIVVVLSGDTSTGDLSFSFDVTFDDGTVESHTTDLNVTEGAQDAGWGQGKSYMLETDENDDVIVETGDVHRPVYVTESDDAVTRADIAAMEGLDESDITTEWLVDHPEYGGSEIMALSSDIGLEVWESITSADNGPTSNWLLFERGYEYEGTDRLVGRGSNGEDELHPMHITAWGDGELPVLLDRMNIYQETSSNVVFTDLQFAESVNIVDSENLLFDDVHFTGDEAIFKGTDGLTIRNSEISDVFRDEDVDGDGVWEAHEDRISGLYVAGGNGTLIDGNLIDHNGWEEDGQPASMWSHNVYLQYNTKDVTFTNNIVMQGASYGAQLRGGAFATDNVFIENNAGVNFVGGDYKEYGTIGNYTWFEGNVISSGATKDDGAVIGGKGYGYYNNGEMSVMIDNIVAHMTNPDDPDEQAERWEGAAAQNLDKDPLYNDTIVYNWIDGEALAKGKDWSINAEGLDSEVLDETTIQTFTSALLDKEDASVTDLSDYLRDQADGAFDDLVDAEVIASFFQEGFGLQTDDRVGSATVRFVPNTLGDGVRWDNDYNWSTEDTPGTQDGDSVELAGNWVNYDGTNTLQDFDFGSGGELSVDHGKLTIEGETTTGENGGTFNIDDAGQTWMNGYDDTDTLNINVDGGRFVNTGDMNGSVNMTVTDGDAVLASNDASATFTDGSSLHLIGDDADVGFDGTNGDTAVMRVGDGGVLTFEADEDGDMATIQEFRTGAFGDDSDVQSGVNLEDGTLQIILDADSQVGTEVLISVDELVGSVDRIQITGLSGDNDAYFTVDYDSDEVEMKIIGGGSGEAFYEELGSEDNAQSASALWAALTDGMGAFDETPPTVDLYDDADAMFEDA